MKIKFSTSSDAFRDPFTGKEDDYYKANECIRIMQDILDKIKRGNEYGPIMDINGNKIGEWEI